MERRGFYWPSFTDSEVSSSNEPGSENSRKMFGAVQPSVSPTPILSWPVLVWHHWGCSKKKRSALAGGVLVEAYIHICDLDRSIVC